MIVTGQLAAFSDILKLWINYLLMYSGYYHRIRLAICGYLLLIISK